MHENCDVIIAMLLVYGLGKTAFICYNEFFRIPRLLQKLIDANNQYIKTLESGKELLLHIEQLNKYKVKQ